MNARPAALTAALLLFAVSARAAFPIRRPAPEFPDNAWLNAKPLTLKRLRGRRVALVAFVNTVNVNSLRAMKLLQAWHERYGLQGLMVVGVHTPVFSFQRNAATVYSDLKSRRAEFPVVLDDDRRIWNAYQNEGWPSFYLIDKKGRVVYEAVGEWRYAELEREIQAALADLGYAVKEAGKLTAVDPPREGCGEASPEFSVKTAKGIEDFGTAVAPTTVISAANEGSIYKTGPWVVDGDALRLTARNAELEFSAHAVYRGAQGLVLMSSGPAPKARVFVKQDGLWLNPRNAGSDVKIDADGQSYLDVGEPRLYSVTANANDNARLLTLMPVIAGAAFYGVSATDRCLPYAP